MIDIEKATKKLDSDYDNYGLDVVALLAIAEQLKRIADESTRIADQLTYIRGHITSEIKRRDSNEKGSPLGT